MRGNSFRGGKVHVQATMCPTCIFRPGNLMELRSGRVRGMVDEARANETAIICHATLYRRGIDNAVCRGFFDRYPTQLLQIAQRLDLIEFDSPEAEL